MSRIVPLWRNLSSQRLIHLIGCHHPEKTKARRALVDFPCVGSVRSWVHKFYANTIHKPAINDIFPVMLHAGSLDLITPWLLETSYLKTSIVWSPRACRQNCRWDSNVHVLVLPPDPGWE